MFEPRSMLLGRANGQGTNGWSVLRQLRSRFRAEGRTRILHGSAIVMRSRDWGSGLGRVRCSWRVDGRRPNHWSGVVPEGHRLNGLVSAANRVRSIEAPPTGDAQNRNAQHWLVIPEGRVDMRPEIWVMDVSNDVLSNHAFHHLLRRHPLKIRYFGAFDPVAAQDGATQSGRDVPCLGGVTG